MNEANSISNTWWELPPLIEFLRESRKEKLKLVDSFNISIILHSATIIEGFISQFLNDNLVIIDESPTLKGRLEYEFTQRVEKSSWNELQILYKIMFGLDLSEEVNNEIWKGVTSLFSLRNLLVHSTQLKVTYYEENGDTKISGKYENIYNFLAIEKKLIDKVLNVSTYPKIKLITDKSADYYWENTTAFLKTILQNQKTEATITKVMFEKAFKQNNAKT
ncbi:MAG: hypothetical protein KKG99_16330 [Bacteroidetes bacterium]|nr:hypothetical protein [Bacteroidota bacterium]